MCLGCEVCTCSVFVITMATDWYEKVYYWHSQVAPNGLLVSFLDGFDGVIAMQHLSTPSNHSLEEYQGGKKVVARLLWVDVLVKSVGLTLRERLVQGKGYDFQGVEIGDKYDGKLEVAMNGICVFFT